MEGIERGAITRYVVANVVRLRAEQRLSLAELSARLDAVGRPILPTGLHRLENGKRRIDTDDLVALAIALEVSPLTLLLPPTAEVGAEVALANNRVVTAERAWTWARGQLPLEVSIGPDADPVDTALALREFHRRALPQGLNPFPRDPVPIHTLRDAFLHQPAEDTTDDTSEENDHGQHQQTP